MVNGALIRLEFEDTDSDEGIQGRQNRSELAVKHSVRSTP